MDTIQDVQEYASKLGLVLTPKELEQIQEVQRAEKARLESLDPLDTEDTFADKWQEFYPRFLSFIVSVGETVLTTSQTIIVALGVPLVLILLLIVEHQRVVHGIMLFEQDYTLGNFGALALVVLNLVLEFTVHYIEHKDGYHDELSRKWSLRIWWANTRYTLGLGEWVAINQSPAQRYKGILRLVTFSILSLALVGSMKTIITNTNGTWYEAILAIATQSSLIDFVVWIGGLLFALSAVLSAQGLSRYVAVRCVEILANQPTKKQKLNRHAQAIDKVGAQTALAIINAKQAKIEQKNKPTPPTPTIPTKEYSPEIDTPKVSITQATAFELLPEVSEIPNPFGVQAPTKEDPVSIKTIESVSVIGGQNGNGNGKH